MRQPTKYGNRRVTVDGFNFASAREARRYGELKLLERAGKIAGLQLQPRFPLKVNDQLVCTYIADFTYLDGGPLGERVVEDAKGFRTREYINKAKLFHAIFGFPVREV